VHVGEFLGDGDRVGNIVFAGLTLLTVMCHGAELVSSDDSLDLLPGEIRLERFDKLPQAVVAF